MRKLLAEYLQILKAKTLGNKLKITTTETENVAKMFREANKEEQSKSHLIDNKHTMVSDGQDDDKIGPHSFIVHGLIGKGSFGEVYLVEKKQQKNSYYAMKVLHKNRIMSILYKIRT